MQAFTSRSTGGTTSAVPACDGRPGRSTRPGRYGWAGQPGRPGRSRRPGRYAPSYAAADMAASAGGDPATAESTHRHRRRPGRRAGTTSRPRHAHRG